jgi:uncharacterized protein (TIGR03118 family)
MTAAISRQRLLTLAAVLFAALTVAVPLRAAETDAYTTHVLVSNTSDSDLVNAWGLDASATSPWWVSDNGTDLSTLYNAAGSKLGIRVPVVGAPTGLVFNSSQGGFPVVVNPTTGATAPALFIFSTESGTIQAWNSAPAPPSHPALIEAGPSDAVYKGLAIAGTGSSARLYATDFANGKVDVFGPNWAPTTAPGGFADPQLPSGYAPFGIQTIGSRIFVTFARQIPGDEDEAHGQGLGIVDAFDTNGNLVARVAQHGQLNAPWGLAWAPDNFGRFSGDLLVGNFGDGEINAYAELPNGRFEHRGSLRSADGGILRIDGLWALEFGRGGANNGPTNTLFFTAGPDDENGGLFGTITAG